ncbi:MAG: hypothetical protein MUO62_14475 [Anaerolineales bacterium]|nr:hypothetical protein [Anaerolineales bacterium]
MPPIKRLFLAIIAVFLFTTECTNQSVVDGTSTTEIEPEASGEELPPPIDVCEPLDISGVAFPRQEYVKEPRAMMEAELIGTLVLIDGCLQIDSLYGDGAVIPVWPAEYTIVTEGDSYAILDGDGNPLIREGEEVYMGGGEGNESGMLECVQQQIPNSCSGKFWFVGDGVRPNLRFDSELFNLSLITTTERTAILLQKKPILDEWKESPSTITGKFVLYTPSRCPRIHNETGMTNYLPIWPPGYTMEFMDGKLAVMDKSGTIIASEGDELTLSGGGIPHSWNSDEYRQLYYNLPGDCHAPHWIVGE